MTVEELEDQYPWVHWREPVLVSLPARTGITCRVCVANLGLTASQTDRLFDDQDEFEAHFAEHH